MMDFEKACTILGIEPGYSIDQVKRKYRLLVAEIHPDSMQYKQTDSSIVIEEANAAYEFLIKQGEYEKHIQKQKAIHKEHRQHRQSAHWDAPLQPGAYIEREIYQYAEDPDGENIGIYRAAVGKYYWNPDAEEFSLFLKSILKAAEQLLEDCEERRGFFISESRRFEAKKELTYLLAGQYTDLELGLEVLSKKKSQDANPIFYMPASMELENRIGRKYKQFQIKERLYPVRLTEHRLYIGKKEGEILGYLSFPDDRLYYVLIPMFENREVQIKIEVADKPKRNRNGAEFVPLHLWVRRISQPYGIQENANQKINKILEQLFSY